MHLQWVVFEDSAPVMFTPEAMQAEIPNSIALEISAGVACAYIWNIDSINNAKRKKNVETGYIRRVVSAFSARS